MTPELVTAFGGVVVGILGAFLGGKKGGENSLNGFKDEVRTGFTSVNGKLDVLTKTDGIHEAKLEAIEKIVDARKRAEAVEVERRRSA